MKLWELHFHVHPKIKAFVTHASSHNSLILCLPTTQKLMRVQISCPCPCPTLCFTPYTGAPCIILVHFAEVLRSLKGVCIQRMVTTYAEDFRWENQACLQANTAEAWAFDFSLIYSRITHICSVPCLSSQFWQHSALTMKAAWDVWSVVVLFLIVTVGENENIRSQNLCTVNAQHLGVIFQGLSLIRILLSLSQVF